MPPYDVPARSSEELARELVSACGRAKQEKRPVLLEFGAAWCKDCRRLGSLAHVEPLASELGRWERVEVNITDPDEHEQLMQTFAVRAIAHWQALLPTRCDAAIGSWRRLASRTVEPKRTDTETAEKLATWLARARRSVSSGR